MPLRAVLLRLLLSLALILEGTGVAVAGVHVPEPPRATPMAACHDMAMGDHAAPAPKPAPAGQPCCLDGHCTCAFTAALALVPASLALASLPAPVHAAHPLAAGHRAPALAHPIRPPIGQA